MSDMMTGPKCDERHSIEMWWIYTIQRQKCNIFSGDFMDECAVSEVVTDLVGDEMC